MRRFYFFSQDRTGNRVLLRGGEAHHLSLVIRAKPGYRAILFNEKGEEFIASVVHTAPRQVELSIVEEMEAPPFPQAVIHCAVALIKAKAIERVLTSVTELGVGKIIVFRCERSIPRFRHSDIDKKLARWERIALSSAKQSGRAVPPEIEYVFSWDELLEKIPYYDRVFFAVPGYDREPFSIRVGEKVLTIVGPEGGFTRAEESSALEGGALPIGLGPFTLRSDTAAVAAVALTINAISSLLKKG